MKEKIKRIYKKINPSKSFVGLLLSIFILISPMLINKYIRGHDSAFHITNMITSENSIELDNFTLTKVFGRNIAKGFGYGTGIFYPPLSYYLTSIIAKILNLNKPNNLLSLPLAEIIIMILSGITMYIFLKKTFKDNKIAGIGSIAYISSTYFLCDIYVRTALAELLTFIFIPLIFLGLYELFFKEEKKFYIPFIIGYVGMIYSQLVMTLYLTIIILMIFLIFIKKVFKLSKLKKLIIASSVILLMTSPYLVLLFEHKIFGNYVVFESGTMYTLENIKNSSLGIKDFFLIQHFGKQGIQVFINPIVLIISVITIIFNKKTFKDNKKIYKIIMIMLIITIFMTSKYFPWVKMPSIVNTIQFPWRLRIIIAFLLAIICSHISKIINFKYDKILIIFISLLITFAGYITINRNNIYDLNEYLEINKSPEGFNGKTDTFDNMGIQLEYLPTNTAKNKDYFDNRGTEIIIKNGSADIDILYNYTPELKFSIQVKSENVILELPRLYYLGYQINLIDEIGNTKNIKYLENDNGFIEISIHESGNIQMRYTGTIASRICTYISIITVIMCTAIIIYKNKQHINIKK